MGAVSGTYGQILLSRALTTVTGFPVVLSANMPIAIVGFFVVTVAAAACIAIPGYRAASVEPYPWQSV
jgi:putative ABC transport system permease protein